MRNNGLEVGDPFQPVRHPRKHIVTAEIFVKNKSIKFTKLFA